MSRVLVLSPHPDDEAIGCGGTLCQHVAERDTVQVVFLTSGEKGGHGRTPAETVRIREQEARHAGKILGLARLEFWGQPDGALRATSEVTDRLRRKIRTFEPDLIYLPHDREMHRDHRAAVRLLRKALSRTEARRRKIAVRMFEIWTPIQRLDEIIDISPFLRRKREAIRAYRSQCDVLAFDDAILGLNRYRGEMHSWPGGDYAEVFTLLRL